ncbi:TonB family protein [Pontibacter sp. 13R65]|uniref:energy transducer TonB n=1 Tax=Pontibacter sp. 13R65 TaxID=3127458 RepID=UPI00301C5AF2
MSSHNSQLIWGTEEHPSLEELRQYQEGMLPEATSQEVERHVFSCEICTDVVEGMVLADRSSTQKAVQSIHFRLHNLKQPKKKRRLPAMPLLDWRAAAAIVALLCSLALVVYYHYTQLAKERPAAVTQAIEPTEVAPAIAATSPEAIWEEAIGPEPAIQQQPAPAAAPGSNAALHQNPPLAAPLQTPAPKKLEPTTAPEAGLGYDNGNLEQAEGTAAPANANKAQAKEQELPKATSSNNISGKVLSENGDGLPGVTVTLKGTQTSTVTDLEGNFTLAAPTVTRTLAFNYIGYAPTETTLDATAGTVEVHLFPSANALNEVVITGYGKAPVTKAPRPVGGTRAFNKYIKENMRYPEDARAAQVKGKVGVDFTVNPTGKVVNAKVTESLHPSCDAEAIRLIVEGPDWQPATSNGGVTSQQVKVSINFKP